jgi:ATP-dependent DNA helicase RecG
MIDTASLQSLLARLDNHTAEELEAETIRFAPWLPDELERQVFLARLAVNLANHSGGTIIVGIQAGVKGKAAVTGCPETDLEGLRRAIHAATSPGILVSLSAQPFADQSLLVVEVPKGIPPHVLGWEQAPTESGQRLALGGQRAEDFSSQLLDVGEEAIDPLEVERLRNTLQAKETTSSLLRLPNNDLLTTLGILKKGASSHPTDGQARLTVAGLLLVGREAVLKEKLPSHEAIYLHMTGGAMVRAKGEGRRAKGERPGETEYDRRVDYRRPLLAILDDLAQQIEPYNRLFTLKVGLFHFEIPDYPPEVYREALLNAFMHRDYARQNPVYVRLYDDRTEISNPGGFPGGITPDNIVSHEPVTRNRLLAEILQKLRLVERSGMGVRRMFTILLASGKEPPVYVATPDDVRIIIRCGRCDEPFARFIARRQQQGEEFALNELIVLTYLKRNQEIDLHEATRILQRNSYEAHEVLGSMVEKGLIEPFGQKKGRVYRLSKAIYIALRQSVEYHLHRDAEAAYAEAAISNYIRQNGFITNQMVRTLLRVNRSQSSYLLQKLVKAGKLVLTGKGTKAQYKLPEPGVS